MWSFDKLKEKLAAISRPEDDSQDGRKGNLTEAAILVPIVVRNGAPFVLVTVRSTNLSRHAGEISFPGGKRDPGDSSLIDTALRETMEEIGLNKERITVLGSLAPYVTIAKFLVTPVVAKVVDFESFRAKLNPFEVSEMLIVPLENFIKKDSHECRRVTFNGTDFVVDTFQFAQNGSVHVIWGLTAVISTDVASLLFDRLPEFEYQEWLSNYRAKKMHDSFVKSRL